MKGVSRVFLHCEQFSGCGLEIVFEYYKAVFTLHNYSLALKRSCRFPPYSSFRPGSHYSSFRRIYVSKSRLFQRLAPRYAKDFWPLPVLNMGIARSVFEFPNSIGCTPDTHEKITEILRCKRVERFVNHRTCFFICHLLYRQPTKSLEQRSCRCIKRAICYYSGGFILLFLKHV